MRRGGRLRSAIWAIALAAGSAWSFAQEVAAPTPATAEPPRFGVHFQLTTVTQWHPSFFAAYSGQNSLSPDAEHETTVTSTLFAGARLWSGGEIWVNPELSGGSGLSKAFGVAGFPNGESFRVGSPEPHIYVGRAFLRQTLAVGTETEEVPDAANQLPGRRPVRRWTLTAGKLGVTDFFDDNAYSHEPRRRFLNWADWSSGAWDYPADTRGYTWGVMIEYEAAEWALHFGAAAEPRVANGLEIDTDIAHAHSFMAQVDRRYRLEGKEGTARFILFRNSARMGNYREAIEQSGGGAPDIVATRRPGRTKWGAVVNLEQSLSATSGIFLRGSWNDGKNEAWAYAEIERSLTAGAVLHPSAARSDDEAGLAFIVNALSADHRDYLAAGGYGFMIGDGRLNYGLEKIAELYYQALVWRGIWLAADYQFVENPAYNRDRGPVHVLGLRFHVEL